MPADSADAEQDPLYDQAVQVVMDTRKASISGVQRRLKIGYNRAARMVESMEAAGLVGPLQSNGSARNSGAECWRRGISEGLVRSAGAWRGTNM